MMQLAVVQRPAGGVGRRLGQAPASPSVHPPTPPPHPTPPDHTRISSRAYNSRLRQPNRTPQGEALTAPQPSPPGPLALHQTQPLLRTRQQLREDGGAAQVGGGRSTRAHRPRSQRRQRIRRTQRIRLRPRGGEANRDTGFTAGMPASVKLQAVAHKDKHQRQASGKQAFKGRKQQAKKPRRRTLNGCLSAALLRSWGCLMHSVAHHMACSRQKCSKASTAGRQVEGGAQVGDRLDPSKPRCKECIHPFNPPTHPPTHPPSPTARPPTRKVAAQALQQRCHVSAQHGAGGQRQVAAAEEQVVGCQHIQVGAWRHKGGPEGCRGRVAEA